MLRALRLAPIPTPSSSRSRRSAILAGAACALLACAAPARADFGVAPIRLDLDRTTRSGVITVSNEGAEPLSFQIRALEWTQDAQGQDRYEPTNDLVYFPQQLQIPPRENRVVRAGYRHPATTQEKTYRIFVEQQAEPRKGGDGTAVNVAVAVRFGVPVFVRPASLEQKAEVAVELKDGSAAALVRNAGPVHFRINSVRFEGLGAGGEKTFETIVDGWYLLSGASRRYAVKLPAEACRKSVAVRVEVLAEKLKAGSEASVAPASCQ